jgi:hypothetical protein
MACIALEYWVCYILHDLHVGINIKGGGIRVSEAGEQGATQMRLSKHASGHCAVRRMMKMHKHWEHIVCPWWCLQDNETTEHVILCQDPQAAKHFERLSKKLRHQSCYNGNCSWHMMHYYSQAYQLAEKKTSHGPNNKQVWRTWSFQTSGCYWMKYFYARMNGTRMGSCTTMLLWLAQPPKNRKTMAGHTNSEHAKPVLGYMGPQEQNIAHQLASVESA